MKGNLIIGGIAAVGIAMGVTNPKPEAYTEFISEKLLTEGEKALCKQTDVCRPNSSSSLVKKAVNLFKGEVAKPALKRVVIKSTTRQNFLLFSLYTTAIPDVISIKTLGVFNHFLIYSKS